ncbi:MULTISPECIES: hypothetical protein [unclassified Methanoculleus]|uniref:hypothetical protein n=1 Tax=unclassified Methanoculleus TaxID=2619537 RepID=UPI0025D32396|nr:MULTISPECIES: hypothetical protein [unclassified Methanoculleus]
MFLYYLWVAVLMAILFAFFAEPNAMGAFIVKFPQMVQIWLNTGMLPVFIISGYYLFTRDTMPEAERLPGRAGLAASASGSSSGSSCWRLWKFRGLPWNTPITSPEATSSC